MLCVGCGPRRADHPRIVVPARPLHQGELPVRHESVLMMRNMGLKVLERYEEVPPTMHVVRDIVVSRWWAASLKFGCLFECY